MRMLLILLLAAAAVAQEAPVFRTDVALVKVDVQVAQGRRLIADLTRDDFRVLDEGEPREIVYFGRESEPLWALVLLDVSGSMRQHVRAMAAAARKALDALRPGDSVGVMLFSKETSLFEPFTDNLNEVVARLGEAVNRRGLRSGTSINSSILAAAAYMRGELANRPGRRAIVILTDNKGWNYELPDTKVLEELWAGGIVLNAIVVGAAKPPEPLQEELVTNTDFTPSDVFGLARETGGDVVRAKKAGEAFQTLLESVRTRYSLHFRAPTGEPGTFREIRVELVGDAARRYRRAEIRARRGYYLP